MLSTMSKDADIRHNQTHYNPYRGTGTPGENYTDEQLGSVVNSVSTLKPNHNLPGTVQDMLLEESSIDNAFDVMHEKSVDNDTAINIRSEGS